MLVNKEELVEKIRRKQRKCTNKDIAQIMGKARSYIASIGRDATHYKVKDYEYLQLCENHPDIFELPEDFYFYTLYIYSMNHFIRGSVYSRDPLVKNRRKTDSGIYMYSYKDRMLDTIKKIGDEMKHENKEEAGSYYVPFYKNEMGEMVLYDKAPQNTIKFSEEELEILKKKNEKKIVRKKSEFIITEDNREDFIKYSLMNIKCNLYYHDETIQNLTKYLDVSSYFMYNACQENPFTTSLLDFKEKLDIIFKPYIILI